MTPVTLCNFVNGKHTDPRDGAYSDVTDPSTGELYARAPVSSAADVDEALTAAATAFERWRDAVPGERSLALLKFADAVERRAAEFVAAETRNTGKPVALATTDEVPSPVAL
ncbi:MAG: aldehyde dehydrogenase family protein [Trebonia sp.]|jgi:betaine-aldehyde dehydrogenase